jgi:hypothetical protein
MAILKALPKCDSGVALLEFRNGTDSAIRIFRALASLENVSAGSQVSLLDAAIELSPHASIGIDVTAGLAALFPEHGLQPQEAIVVISLVAEPEPPDQPQPGRYRVAFQRRITQFSAA